MVEEEVQIRMDPVLRPGRWANWARIAEHHGEFMLDLGVRDPVSPREVTVVARIALSDRSLLTLKDEVGRAWQEYAEGELPEEFRDE